MDLFVRCIAIPRLRRGGQGAEMFQMVPQLNSVMKCPLLVQLY